jgi:hypothetical protein
MEIRRTCIYTKDVQRITGKTERVSRKLIQTIKGKLQKEPHQFITIYEFSNYTGIDIEIISKYITD